jgi:uroporphyrinogen-III decarboxylase
MKSALNRDQVARAVEGRGPDRVPLVRAKWWGEGLREQYGSRLEEFDPYPEDVVQLWMPNPVEPSKMGLSWEWEDTGAHDSRVVIDDWGKLDEFIEKLPDPETDEDLNGLIDDAREARSQDRYTMISWWRLFFEKPWALRGMENLLTDFYLEPANIHRLYDAMCRCYCRYLDRAAELLQPDGFFTSDDLGHQTGPMMSPDIFHEFLYPYYVRVGRAARGHRMHFWLHSCGDNTLLFPDLIAAGVDVFHPVQKHTMDEARIAEEFGDQITILAGLDVQHTLQEQSPEGVRAEVRFLIDTFDRPGGRMCLGAGNGIVAGTPLENIQAFLDEAITYGEEHRRLSGA